MSFKPPVGDATLTQKGLVQLSGDLGGTAASPVVTGLSQKVDIASVGQAGGIAAIDNDGDVVNSSGVKVQEVSLNMAIPHNPDAPTIAAMAEGTLYTTGS